MKSAKSIIVAGFLTLFALACSRSETTNTGQPPSSGSRVAATATPDEFAAARATFKENCSKCHGETGDGGLVTVDNKKLKVPNLKQGHALKHSDEDFVDQITKGGDGMPSFKDKLKPEQIHDLVRFVRKEFQGK